MSALLSTSRCSTSCSPSYLGRPRLAARRALRVCSSASSEVADAKPRALAVPTRPSDQCNQAAAAISAAFKAGIKRQRVELMLPLIGATDLDDWPGGVRQQFKAIQPMVEQVLRFIKQTPGLEGPLTPEIWDDGDAVACYQSSKIALIIFPIASSVDRIRKIAEGKNAPELIIIVNPQWETQGNLVSDFGFGPWRAAKEEFIKTFTPSYWLRQQRVYGDMVWVLKGFPASWQLHVAPAQGGPDECIGTQETLPTYAEIEEVLRQRPGSSMNKSVVQRLQEEWEFNRKSMDQGANGGQ